jgi:hypothetical protein
MTFKKQIVAGMICMMLVNMAVILAFIVYVLHHTDPVPKWIPLGMLGVFGLSGVAFSIYLRRVTRKRMAVESPEEATDRRARDPVDQGVVGRLHCRPFERHRIGTSG